MGAKRVVKWVPKSNGADAKAFEFLCKAAESLRGGKRQQHRVECLLADVKRAGPSGAVEGRQTLFQISSVEEKTTFLVLPTARKVMASSCGLVGKGALLEKIGMGGGSTVGKRGIQFEGLKYVLGDFVVYIAQASNISGNREFLGVVAEVEYLPLASLSIAAPVLEEFLTVLKSTMEGLSGSPEGELQFVAVDHKGFGLKDECSALHSALNYQSLCRACSA